MIPIVRRESKVFKWETYRRLIKPLRTKQHFVRLVKIELFGYSESTMSQSLYRKWRPQVFSELVGQDNIRDTLFYALTHDQVSHAYLFCGPRGTGKTTTARLIAKLVNCLSHTTTKPCNNCSACQTITTGTNLDVVEIDAASNRGIDEMRQLKELVRFAPTQATYKVFIIDEAHMLTREAFNALLKTLEEPPATTLFILATTENHKIPATITSRCQRYDFRLASRTAIADHLLTVAKAEAIPITPDGAAFLSELADGSFRDALTLLEQIQTAQLNDYSRLGLENFFGYVPRSQMETCLAAILQGQTAEAHRTIDSVIAQGSDIRAFAGQLLVLSQEVLERATLTNWEGIDPASVAIYQTTEVAAIVGWVERLLEAISQMKQCPIARLPLDLAITKHAVTYHSIESATRKIASAAPQSQTPVTPKVVVITETASPSHTSEEKSTVSVPVAVTVPQAVEPEKWTQFLQQLKSEAPSLVTSLAQAKVIDLAEGCLKVAVRYKMHADKINQPKNRQKIEAVLESVWRLPLKIEAHVVKELVVEEEVGADVSDIFEFED